MDRRKALKNMGLAMGYTVATPAVMSLLNSCKEASAASWTPRFFSPAEGKVLIHIVDILLPKTDTPSASEVNVHIFIDRYLDEVMALEQQSFIRMLMEQFTALAQQESGKDNLEDLESDDIEPVIASALQPRDPASEKAHEDALGAYMEAMAKGEKAELDKQVASVHLAKSLRGFSIWAYKNTEYIGERVLPYAPVPGENIPCGDLEELTGGKVWSPEM